MSNENKRALSDFPGHVLLRMGNVEHGMDLTCAEELFVQLGQAINEAQKTPLQRWFDGLPIYKYDSNQQRKLFVLSGHEFAMTFSEAEAFYNLVKNL